MTVTSGKLILLFSGVVVMFYLPKRSGWQVVSTWLQAHPHLLARKSEFKQAMNALATDKNFIHTLYPKKHLTRTCSLSASWPELAFFSKLFTDELP